MKNPAIFFTILFLSMMMLSCKDKKEVPHNPETFSFAFMTDLHLNFSNERSFAGFEQAIDRAKELGVDFIITGGDNVDADMVGDDIALARRMYSRFLEIINQSATEIHVTIGNHDRFWHQTESADSHGAALFGEYFPKTYYGYSFNGVHFIHLNTSEVCDGKYCVSEDQRNWITSTLDTIPHDAPVVLIAHVPFLSLYYPVLYGHYTHTDVFDGFKDVWDMFKGHNLQLVLQGHMHLFEEINLLNTQFITGGALSGKWWGGDYHGTAEGFVHVQWDGHAFHWEYVDFGWNASAN